MDKSVILAVAGSGKTRLLIDRLNLDDRFLIVTYTNNNFANLRERIICKFGCIPKNIKLYTYFGFLHGFCYKPLLSDLCGSKGINWDIPPTHTLKLKRSNTKFYFDGNNFLYHNRIAKLLEQTDSIPEIHQRLDKYFDCLMIDEMQDFGGHDLNFLCSLSGANLEMLLVGDFYQHTFNTSRDGVTNGKVYDDYEKYLLKLEGAGFEADKNTLLKSFRCSQTICAFVQQNLGVQIESNRADDTEIYFIDNEAQAVALLENDEIVKLFYADSVKYPCHSENWGKSKGQNHYNDVCVVLNQTSYKAFKSDKLSEMVSLTKNKFYVACTRARGDLYFVSDSFFKKYKIPIRPIH